MAVKIENTSRWSDSFIRRMLKWAIKDTETRGMIGRASFRNRGKRCYSGHAWFRARRIVVSIGPDSAFPKNWSWNRAYTPGFGFEPIIIADAIEALVAVTAHELGHLFHFNHGHTGRDSEARADARARGTLRRFRENREALMADWSKAPPAKAEPAREPVAMAAVGPAPDKPARPSIVDARAAEAAAMLAKWERKLKMAKTKAAKYRAKVKYYERRAARRPG